MLDSHQSLERYSLIMTYTTVLSVYFKYYSKVRIKEKNIVSIVVLFCFGNRRIANPTLLALTLKVGLIYVQRLWLEKPEEPFRNTECLPNN